MWISIIIITEASGQQAPGATVGVWAPAGFGDLSAVNTSITGDGTTVWIALEELEQADGNEPALSIFRKSSPWSPTTPVASKLYLQSRGSLADAGMYPSIVTWPGASEYWVTAKHNDTVPNTHLRVWRQDRSDFSAPWYVESVTSTSTGFDHGRNQLIFDATTNEQYLCWTRKSGSAEDVWSKVKDQSTWTSSSGYGIAQTSDVEDHCIQAFHTDGSRFTVYHRDAASSDVRVDVGMWNGASWSQHSDFALDGSAGADFPSIYTTEGHGVGESRIYIVAKSSSSNVLYWQCEGAVTDCDSSIEFCGDHFQRRRPFRP